MKELFSKGDIVISISHLPYGACITVGDLLEVVGYDDAGDLEVFGTHRRPCKEPWYIADKNVELIEKGGLL